MEMGTAAFAVYKFGRFALHPGRGAFLVDGVEHSLRPKSFALMRLFAENPGRLIDRDEIMRTVWPGIFVTDDSIAQCISEVRRALGDNDQRLLRTLPRRGYRFIASVIAEQDNGGVASVPLADVASPPRVDAVRAAIPTSAC